jgi:hypothetical protein
MQWAIERELDELDGRLQTQQPRQRVSGKTACLFECLSTANAAIKATNFHSFIHQRIFQIYNSSTHPPSLSHCLPSKSRHGNRCPIGASTLLDPIYLAQYPPIQKQKRLWISLEHEGEQMNYCTANLQKIPQLPTQPRALPHSANSPTELAPHEMRLNLPWQLTKNEVLDVLAGLREGGLGRGPKKKKKKKALSC